MGIFFGKFFLNVLVELRESWDWKDFNLFLVLKLFIFLELFEFFWWSVEGMLLLLEDLILFVKKEKGKYSCGEVREKNKFDIVFGLI